MEQKTLAGIVNQNVIGLGKLGLRIADIKPRISGIGLPPLNNACDLYSCGNTFFEVAYKMLERSGSEIVYLEDQRLWEEYQSIKIAKSLINGELQKADIKKELYKTRKKMKSYPEQADILINLGHRFEHALDNLKHLPDAKSANLIEEVYTILRAAYSIRRIDESCPDFILVEDSVAEIIKSETDGTYKRIKI